MSIDRPKPGASNDQQYTVPSVSVSAPHNVPSRLAVFAARQPEHRINSFCGAAAGAASGIVTCPLDVIKTKLQGQGGYSRQNASPTITSRAPAYRGLLGTASVIWKQDGLRGMYRGLGPMMLGYLPTWAVYMTVYGSARDYYYTRLGPHPVVLPHQTLLTSATDNKFLAQTSASITAGACSSITTNPIWVIKTRLMSQVGATAAKDSRTPWHYHNTLDAFRKIYRNEGILSFYSGLAPALLGLTHVAIQFPLYEYFKLRFTGAEFGEAGATGQRHGQTAGILAATFLSKVCATCATYPHEVLRTRLQTQQKNRAIAKHNSRSEPPPHRDTRYPSEKPTEIPRYSGILPTCRTILREEGWRAFYHGMGTNLVRAVPAAMTTLLTFETLKGGIMGLAAEGREATLV